MARKKIRFFVLGSLVILAGIVLSTSLLSQAFDTAESYEASFTYEAQGKYPEALNSVLQILQNQPSDYIANLRSGWLSYLKGDYEAAEGYYKKSASLMPKAIEPKLGLMLPLMALKKWNEAESIGKELLAVDTHNYLVNSRLAFIYYSSGQLPKAEQFYLKVLDWYPSDTEMMIGLGWTYKKLGKPKEAKEFFTKVLSIHRQELRVIEGLKGL